MVSRLHISIVVLAFPACGSEKPPHRTAPQAQVEIPTPWTSESPGALSSAPPQTLTAGQGSSTPPSEPACEACSFDCLDQAEALKTKDPMAAKKLAVIGCDIAKCGHLGRVMMMRCGEYGLPPTDPMDCQNECIAECNGEAPRSAAWDKCMKGCEATRGCSAD